MSGTCNPLPARGPAHCSGVQYLARGSHMKPIILSRRPWSLCLLYDMTHSTPFQRSLHYLFVIKWADLPANFRKTLADIACHLLRRAEVKRRLIIIVVVLGYTRCRVLLSLYWTLF